MKQVNTFQENVSVMSVISYFSASHQSLFTVHHPSVIMITLSYKYSQEAADGVLEILPFDK